MVSTLAGNIVIQGPTDGCGSAAAFFSPVGVALNAAGSLALVAEYGSNRVRRINVPLRCVTTLAGSLAGYEDGRGVSALFNSPTGVSFYPTDELAFVVSGVSEAL